METPLSPFRDLGPQVPDKSWEGRKVPTKNGATESMAMKFHGNVRGKVRVNFLAIFASKRHILMCGAFRLFRIVRAHFFFGS